jgi:hypothetical protein
LSAGAGNVRRTTYTSSEHETRAIWRSESISNSRNKNATWIARTTTSRPRPSPFTAARSTEQCQSKSAREIERFGWTAIASSSTVTGRRYTCGPRCAARADDDVEPVRKIERKERALKRNASRTSAADSVRSTASLPAATTTWSAEAL